MTMVTRVFLVGRGYATLGDRKGASFKPLKQAADKPQCCHLSPNAACYRFAPVANLVRRRSLATVTLFPRSLEARREIIELDIFDMVRKDWLYTLRSVRDDDMGLIRSLFGSRLAGGLGTASSGPDPVPFEAFGPSRGR